MDPPLRVYDVNSDSRKGPIWEGVIVGEMKWRRIEAGVMPAAAVVLYVPRLT